MSDYEIIMLLLQVLAIVIAFGALVALICLTKRVIGQKVLLLMPMELVKY